MCTRRAAQHPAFAEDQRQGGEDGNIVELIPKDNSPDTPRECLDKDGEYQFSVKYVRSDKKDGIYLPEQNGGKPAIWHWKP